MTRASFRQLAHEEYLRVLEDTEGGTEYANGLRKGAYLAYEAFKSWNKTGEELREYVEAQINFLTKFKWDTDFDKGLLAGWKRMRALLMEHLTAPPTVGRYGHEYKDWRGK